MVCSLFVIFTFIVEFQTGECGVLESDVDGADPIAERELLVCFERGRDGQMRLCVSVHDVHQFLSFKSSSNSNHHFLIQFSRSLLISSTHRHL